MLALVANDLEPGYTTPEIPDGGRYLLRVTGTEEDLHAVAARLLGAEVLGTRRPYSLGSAMFAGLNHPVTRPPGSSVSHRSTVEDLRVPVARLGKSTSAFLDLPTFQQTCADNCPNSD